MGASTSTRVTIYAHEIQHGLVEVGHFARHTSITAPRGVILRIGGEKDATIELDIPNARYLAAALVAAAENAEKEPL